MNLQKQIESAARQYAGLVPGFDMQEELYYNKQAVDLYNAFIAGARAHEALDFGKIIEI